MDFVAHRGDEILFGEVASRADARREGIDALAEQVAAVPGARLEVYWAGSTDAVSPDPDHVRRYIREADTIADASPQAALLMAFAALEGAVAIFAGETGIRPGRTPWQTVSNLYSLGYVSEPDFNILRRLYELRSSIAHAASPRIPQLEDIRFCLDLASRMLEGRYVTADRLIEWFSRQYKSRQEPAAGDGMGQNEIVAILSAAFPYAANATVSEAADWLRVAGADEQVPALADRAAAYASLDDPYAVASLLSALRRAGANEQAALLLARDPASHARLDDPCAIASLLDELREAGANEQAALLATCAAESTSQSLIEAGTGRRCLRTDLTARGLAVELSFEWRGARPPEGRHWRYTKEKLDQMYADGRIEFRNNGLPVGKRYLDEQSGTPAKS